MDLRGRAPARTSAEQLRRPLPHPRRRRPRRTRRAGLHDPAHRQSGPAVCRGRPDDRRRRASRGRGHRTGPRALPQLSRHHALRVHRTGHHHAGLHLRPHPAGSGAGTAPGAHHDGPGHPVERRRLRRALPRQGGADRTHPAGRLVGRAPGPHTGRAAARAAADQGAVARAAQSAGQDRGRTRLAAGPSPYGTGNPDRPPGRRRRRAVHAGDLRDPARRRARRRSQRTRHRSRPGGTDPTGRGPERPADPGTHRRGRRPGTVRRGLPALLERIVGPLLDNGLRHADSGVSLHVSGLPGGVRIDVTDDGPGVPGPFVPYLFHPGRRAAPDDEHTGAGLGLSLARRLARSAGGDVRYDELHATGARFVVSLPAG